MTGTRPLSSNCTLSGTEVTLVSPSLRAACHVRPLVNEPNRDAGLHHVLFDLGYAVLAEMEDARGEDRACSGVDGCDHVLRTSRPTGRDYGEGRLLGYGGDQVEVISGLRPICIHAVEHELPRPPPLSFDQPPDGIHPRVDPSAVQVDLPARGEAAPLHVHAQHDALTPEAFRSIGDEIRVPHGGAVYGDLVGPRAQHGAHVAGRPYAAADRVWYEDLLGGAARKRGGRVPLFVGGGDIVEDNLICPLRIVEGRELHRVSGVPQVGEVRPLYHPPGIHVEAGYDADFEAHRGSSPFLVAHYRVLYEATRRAHRRCRTLRPGARAGRSSPAAVQSPHPPRLLLWSRPFPSSVGGPCKRRASPLPEQLSCRALRETSRRRRRVWRRPHSLTRRCPRRGCPSLA